ncbi:MAG: alpha/beta hydrolase [Anaerolineaceae bacterium]|nr:alpha/beta hydrolase [Anaerolineaceae bacterium]
MKRNRILGRLALGGALLIGVILVLAAAAAVYQALAARAEERAYPPPGQLVDVGGHRLHLYCLGEGSPTVILESGAGEATPLWAWIQPEVARTTRVCAYDRAGFGWSDPGPQPRDAQTVVAELQRLLHGAGVEPPYILAGHSLGGEFVRLFAHQYPESVSGLVFIDSGHPDLFERIPEIREENAAGERLSRVALVAAPLGLMRLYWADDGPNPDLPARQREEMRAFWATSRPYRAQVAEAEARAATDEQVRATGDLGSLPLMVVTTEGEGTWRLLQEEIAGLSTNSAIRIVEGSTHMGLLTDARQAEATTAALLEVVSASRSGNPLR